MSQGRRAHRWAHARRASTSRRTRRRLLVIATALLLALVGLVVSAQANVGGFEGADGDQAAANCATALDWQCLTLPPPNPQYEFVSALDPQGSDDLAFIGSNKEQDIDSWDIGPGSVPPAKADVQGAWSYSSTDASHTTNYLDLAFNRASGSGDSYLAFELNQSSAKYVNSAGSSVTCRTNGDVVIEYDISNNAPLPLNIYKWQWTSGTPCTAGASGSFSAPVTLPAADAEVSINASGPITNYLSTAGLGNTFATSTFGEAAVNLTSLANAIHPSATCEFFNHMQMTSRSSQAITSTMEDYLDGGPVVARACQTGGGGGNPPAVNITAPPSNACSSNGTVVLNGTSDQSEVEVLDGNTVVGNAPVDGSGNWTLTLSGVADGQHSYSAVATDAAGTTTSNTVAVTVNSAGCPAGSPSASGGPGGGATGVGGFTGTNSGLGSIGAQTAASCTPKRLVLTDVFPLHNRTHLLGVAPTGTPGSNVTIISLWNHKVVARPKVARDLSFSATVSLPPASLRLTNRARYVAKLGKQTSLALKFARRMYNIQVVGGSAKVVFRGLIVPPLSKPLRMVVIRASRSCAKVNGGVVVAKARPTRHGSFAVTFKLPSALSGPGVVFLRAQTSVRKFASKPKTYPTFTLIRGITIR